MSGIEPSEIERGSFESHELSGSKAASRGERDERCRALLEVAQGVFSSIHDTSDECQARKKEVYALIEKSRHEDSDLEEATRKIQAVLKSVVHFVPADQQAAVIQRIEPSAVSASQKVETAQIPPILDGEVFFKDPEICAAQLSPDGRYMSFLKPSQGFLNVWVKKTDEPFEAAHPVTHDSSRSIYEHSWSRDGRYILYSQDQAGDENFHMYAVDPYSESPARDLTPYGAVKTKLLCIPKSPPNIPNNPPNEVCVGLNERDVHYHDVYCINLSTGERRLVQQNNDDIGEWFLDLYGNVRVGMRATSQGDTELLRVDPDGMHPVWSCSKKESVRPIAFHKDGRHLYMATNKGDTNLSRLVLLDSMTGEEKVVDSDPEGEVDFEEMQFSEKTDELVATTYVGDRLRRYFKDKEGGYFSDSAKGWESDFQVLKRALPKGCEIYFITSMQEDDKWIVRVRSDIAPQTAYLFDRTTKKLEFLYKSFPSLPTEHLAPMRPIAYTSGEGQNRQTIHGYLTIPKGREERNLPLVVFPHGGPWARDTWGYNSYVQYLANRGYAVLQMNFRGSTGYGKNFETAGHKQFGDMMQLDITNGVKYLIDRQIVDPGRVAIFGVSYGGYATIAGLAFTPEVYKAGISIAGYANLITLLNSRPEDWVMAKGLFKESIGDPSNPEDVARLERQSPLFSADKIVTPLMVIQGARDPRVKKAEADRIVVALRDLRKEVDYLLAPDEGHGLAASTNILASMAAVEKFLAKHIGGLCQENVPEPITARLREITVDVNTVELKEEHPTKPPK